MKKALPIFISALLSALIVFVLPFFSKSISGYNTNAETISEESILTQEISSITTDTHIITKLYDSGKLVGIINDESKIDDLLEKVYKEKYEADYPNSSVDIGKNIYLVNENSIYNYQNIDNEICNYLLEKDAFTVEAHAIEFSDANGIYATIYVNDIEAYNNALNKYLSYFIAPEALNAIQNNSSVGELTTYGSIDKGISILQNITETTAYADPNEIMKSEDEIMEFLEYGYNTEKEYYTVQDGDSIEGVGSMNYGLSAQQVVNINSDVLKNTEQILKAGDVLCITYFTSPIDIVVTKDAMKKEPVYPSGTLYLEDPELQEGKSYIETEESLGSQNTLYEETWINGVLVQGNVVSSSVTIQPQQEIIRVGSKEIPGVGTGTFRWPVDNPIVTCRIGCYYGHTGTDIQNQYDRYGNVYAADRGTVVVNAYHPINGNYMEIDHGNGYLTYYGHMNVPGFIEVGQKVDKGQIIGQIGRTGVATGPHVHFEIHLNDVNIDACNFLDC